MIRTLTFGMIAFGFLVASAEENALPKSPELDVLSRYVGVWDIAFDPDDPFSQGSLNGEWVLGGAFLEQTGELKARFVSRDATTKVLTTFDVGTKQYKRWSFVSNGRSFESSGTWDSKTSTMTWVSEQLDPSSKRTVLTKTTEEFRDAGTVEVCKVATSAGREVGRSIERRSRRK